MYLQPLHAQVTHLHMALWVLNLAGRLTAPFHLLTAEQLARGLPPLAWQALHQERALLQAMMIRALKS